MNFDKSDMGRVVPVDGEFPDGELPLDAIMRSARRHSGPAVGSVIVGLMALLVPMTAYPVLFYAYDYLADPAVASPDVLLEVIGVVLAGFLVAMSFVGLCLAGVGLCQHDRKKECAYVGLPLNVILLVSGVLSVVLRILQS